MVPIQHPHQHLTALNKVLLLLLLLFFIPTLISAHSQRQARLLLELEDNLDDPIPIKKKPNPTITATKTSSKNQTKLIKPSSSSSKNQTKSIPPSSISSKNQTKLTKPSSSSSKNQTKSIQPSSISSNNQTKLTKSSSISTKNQTKITKPSSISSKNQTSHIKTSSIPSKNQTKLTKATTTGALKNQTNLIKSTPLDPSQNKTKSTKPNDSSSKPQIKTQNSTSNSTPKKSTDPPKLTSPKKKSTKETSKTSATKPKSKIQIKPQNQIGEEDEDEDLISAFRDLPYKFHKTFVPDLERISKTSRIYLTNYNQGIAEGFKPYVGNKHAPTVASIASFGFIIIPLILVSLIFNRITAYFSLQKILIFIQFYLSVYFAILCLSTLFTGIEPLGFFYSASRSTYVGVQIVQTLAYVLYLLLLLMYLVLAFSSDTGLGGKVLGLAQIFVGFSIGLHYYVTVFHRAVLHQPPKTGWKGHALYATCFLVICLLGTAGRRKKAYVEEGGEEGKRS